MDLEFGHFFEIESEVFNGPIDLLLHLVKKNELPIEKISLAKICDQYLDCLTEIENFDLEVAAEYLVIAATLVAIKSSFILNLPYELEPDSEDDGLDPHNQLLQRLREAAIYKDSAKALAQRNLLGIDVFATSSCLKDFPSPEIEFAKHDAFILGKAFRALLQGLAQAEKLYEVNLEAVSVVETMVYVLEELKRKNEPVDFKVLLKDKSNKASLIAGLIALLELCKRQVVKVYQAEIFDTVMVELILTSIPNNLELNSEFDSIKTAISE